MHRLVKLDLSKNSLQIILNQTFYGLSSLDFLSLQYNQLRYVPGTFHMKAFQGLTALKSLLLEGNQLYFGTNFTYPHQALSYLPTLENLWLDGYSQPLGPGFSALQNLSYLTFSAVDGICYMRSMPVDFFANLATKRPLSLGMRNCSIKDIPPKLFTFTPTIHSLDISYNKQLTIDGFERASKGLQNSRLTFLNISRIVEPFTVCSFIRNTTFQYLINTTLKVLLVEKCQLAAINPRAVLDLPRTIEYISLRHNMIKLGFSFYTISRLEHLKVIDVSGQLIFTRKKRLALRQTRYSGRVNPNSTSIKPISFRSMEIVKQPITPTFHLMRNTLGKLSKRGKDSATSFCDASSDSIGRSSNSLKISFIVLPLPRMLEVLYASDIKFSYNIDTFRLINNKVLKLLDLSANNIRCLGGPISGLTSVQYVDFSRNFCFQLNPSLFVEMPNLVTLLLYHNRLGQPLAEDLEGITFSPLKLLETLDLSFNVIEDLPELTFKNNTNLRVLNLSNNVIRQFRTSLAHQAQLETLDLSFNTLAGFSESTCRRFKDIKGHNPNFTVDITGNKGFECICENLYFLNFFLNQPTIFEHGGTFQCELSNGSTVFYAGLAEYLPLLGSHCVTQDIFVSLLVTFFLTIGSLAVFSLYHYKRWQWKYLYYVGRSRLHIGSTYAIFKPAAHAYVTYDQENLRLRRMMKQLVLPRLHQMGITTVFGEIDFCGAAQGLGASIAGAVTSTGKTLVFLSKDIFQDYYRQTEVNLAIMHELHLRKPVLVPVLILDIEALPVAMQKQARKNQEPAAEKGACEPPNRIGKTSVTVGNPRRANRNTRGGQREPRQVNNFLSFIDLVRHFPPEISVFLQGQVHRCLVYTGDTEHFWQQLGDAILTE